MENIEVQEVRFLTPAKIKVLIDGSPQELLIGVDIVGRKVYDNSGDTSLSDSVFAYLDRVNTLPEDFFMASDEIRSQAAEAQVEHERLARGLKGNL